MGNKAKPRRSYNDNPIPDENSLDYKYNGVPITRKDSSDAKRKRMIQAKLRAKKKKKVKKANNDDSAERIYFGVPEKKKK